MTGHKQLEKSLKRPDSFQDHILKAIQFVTNNRRMVLMMLSPVVAVALIGYSVFSYMNHKSVGRRAELASLFAMQASEQSGLGKQRESMQKEIDALRSTKPAADGKKTEISGESLAKVAFLEKQMADLKPDTSASTAAFKKFYDNNLTNTEGWTAGLLWASSQLQDNKTADARPVIEAIAKSSTSNVLFQRTSRFMLVGIMEDAGEFDAAIKECDVLAGLATDDVKPAVLLTKGRLQYFKKSYTEARAVLNEIVDKYASSPEATKARSLMAAMGSV
jgi:predicted negative regulator of RcsB-dependent stress response